MRSILNKLMDSHLEIFANSYKNTAYELFYDENTSRLIHPGEYGGWRESLVRDLLSSFLPEAYGVSQGFVVAPNGDISNQCDVIVYARYYTPIIRTPEHQRFFPIESVIAVGEVKSAADGTILKDALAKLVKVKEMRANLESPAIEWQKPQVGSYQPESFVRDQIGTFIFAEKFSISKKTVAELLRKSTEGKHASLKVNQIVSIDDYCTTYISKDEGRGWMYPIWTDGTELPLRFDEPISPSHPHLKLFIRYLLLIIESATILTPELTYYFGGIQGLKHIPESEV